MIKVILSILIIFTWLIFMLAVLLMAPKWGIWFWITGISWSNEYWSKKSIENTLKKIAIISWILFIFLVFIYPYF